MKEDDLQEILTIFKSESEEHLQKLNEGILTLEKQPGKKDTIEEIFREAHSLKGAARMIGFEEIEKVAHSIEDIFNEARKGKLQLTGKLSDYILEGLDLINKVLDLKLRGKGEGTVEINDYLERREKVLREGDVIVHKGKTAPLSKKDLLEKEKTGEKEVEDLKTVKPPAEKKKLEEEVEKEISLSIDVKEQVSRGIQEVEDRIKVRKQKEEADVTPQYTETIRVSIDKLDELMAQVGEILVAKIRSDQRLQEVKTFLNQFSIFQREWHRFIRHVISKPLMREDEAHQLTEFLLSNSQQIDSLMDQVISLSDCMADENLRLELISRDIQESVNRIRMLPMSAIFNYFPRLVRDISKGQGKEVDLVIKGGETRLDKRILEELKDPLTHLLRNSIDHGLETPDKRLAANKPKVGTLFLAAYQKGNNVLVELEDDGSGIDPEKIKEVAIKRGFASAETLSEMTLSQLMQIIFNPGFSTKSIITDVSGRGVGLDVVLTNIERLKGNISTSSTLGKGTKFSIKLPLTLATIQSLLVRCANQRFAIPITAVEFTGEVGLDEISTVEGKETVIINDQPVNLIQLADLLEISTEGISNGQSKVPLVVLSSTDDLVAFAVDEFIGEKEVVVKNLGSILIRVPNVAGATILADGTPVIILNVFDLIKNAQKARGLWITEKMREREKKKDRPTIMVVDDSITTRTLEKNILESSGYEVITAVDGVEALEKLKRKNVDLVVSDIQMPRMDGFEFTSKLKKDKKGIQMPVVLVTSLESEEDKKKGIEVGADAYITKGAFDQGNLLNTIKQLL